MNKDKTPLILVDGSSYLYRAFHALPALNNSKGFPTGAIYGVINMLKRLMLDYSPTQMAVVFDAKGKTFRDELYADYKATRQQMPSDLSLQIEPIHQLIRALGLPLIMVDGVEADDVIATLATLASSTKTSCVISTGDKDLAQLVNREVSLINTMTNSFLDETGVKTKFGVRPDQIVDYLTLVGDSSDNIPGVAKVGPKTAARWLDTYGSLENLVANADRITGKVGENLRQFIPQIPLTRSLVTVKNDLVLPFKLEECLIKAPDKTQLMAFYKEFEFKNWLAELLDERQEESETNHLHYELITTDEKLKDWVDQLSQSDLFAFDTETTHLDYMNAQLVGLAFALSKGKAAYIPLMHHYPGAPQQLSKEQVLRQLKPIFENPHIQKVAQNLKYDMEILKGEGIQLQGKLFDTMLQSYVLDSAANKHGLDTLALKYLGWRLISYEAIAGKGAKQLCFNQIELQVAGRYAAEDADATLQLHEVLWPRILEDKKLKRIYEEIEMPLIPVLARMECAGVLIDPERLKAQGIQLAQRLKTLEAQAYVLAGEKFNINSPKQLQAILFEKLAIPVLRKTPTGQPSTADDVLQELALNYELPRLIIECRSLGKLISTYTNRLVEQCNASSKRIHTNYNQTVTATGRLSSSDPNLQNIPIRTAEGRRIREAFIAPSGYQMLSADYSQIELRLMAHLSQDPNLVHAFTHNLDIHEATAAEVWNVPLDEVTSDLRRNAKAINFGLIYGMSAFGLSKQLGIDRHAAQAYIDRYFARYPNVRDYMDNARSQAKACGYVETIWGRRLYVPDINASKIPRQKAAERIAINAPLQGSAADIIKLAMINIQKWLGDEKMDAKMVMQVHDELVFEVAVDQLEKVTKKVREYMESVMTLRIPLVVSIGIGDDWNQAAAH